MDRISFLLLIIILLLSLFLRIFSLTDAPAALYWDEIDVGYQAYSILKTGKDYFGNYPGLVIHSFADFRAPILIYATIPFVALLGLTELSVRLPAALFGVLSVFLSYILARILFKSQAAGFFAALLTTFSPWNFQYSRMAFEATLMLCLYLGGVISFLKGINSQKWLILASVLFGLTLFTYNTSKLFVPLMFLVLVLVYFKKQKLGKKFWTGVGLFITFFLISLYTTFFQGGGQRFSEISVFSDPQLAAKIDLLRSQSAVSYSNSNGLGAGVRTLDSLIYSKPSLILQSMIQNYLEAFSSEFLFISGDPNLRHSTGKVGEFYPIEAILMILGFFALFTKLKKGDKNSLIMLFWTILAPIPAIITRDGGNHATRLFFLFPALTLISSLGLVSMFSLLPRKISISIVFLIILIFFTSSVTHINHYFGSYKIESARSFQYGFFEAVDEAFSNTASYDYVIIDDRRDSAFMHYLFKTKTDPKAFQENIFGLETEMVGSQAYKIGRQIIFKPGIRSWQEIFAQNLIPKNYLLVVSAQQLAEETPEKVANQFTSNQKLLKVIYYKDNNPAFYVIESRKPENLAL